MTTSSTRIFSDLPIPPGEVLEEELGAIGMTQKELAARLDRPPQVVNEIIRGKKAITPETALGLEKVLGIPASFWVSLEATYRMTIARNKDRDQLAGPIEKRWKVMATPKQRETAWQNTPRVRGKNPNLYRRDVLGNEIYKPAYGTMGPKGWEVDHSNPKSRGGTDSSRNLQAMQSRANRSKGRNYPY